MLELAGTELVVLAGLPLMLPLLPLLNLPPMPGPGKLGALGFMGNLDCVIGLLLLLLPGCW